MGADMIGYIVVSKVGVKPTQKQKDAALKKACVLMEVAKRACCSEPGAEVDRGSNYIYEDNLLPGDKKIIGSMQVDDLEQIAQLDPEDLPKIFEDFREALQGEYRDQMRRTITINRKKYDITTAGEMSWGDEPSSGGYEALKLGFLFGFDKCFGVL